MLALPRCLPPLQDLIDRQMSKDERCLLQKTGGRGKLALAIITGREEGANEERERSFKRPVDQLDGGPAQVLIGGRSPGQHGRRQNAPTLIYALSPNLDWDALVMVSEGLSREGGEQER